MPVVHASSLIDHKTKEDCKQVNMSVNDGVFKTLKKLILLSYEEENVFTMFV